MKQKPILGNTGTLKNTKKNRDALRKSAEAFKNWRGKTNKNGLTEYDLTGEALYGRSPGLTEMSQTVIKKYKIKLKSSQIKKIICFLIGHKYRVPDKPRKFIYCQRCGKFMLDEILKNI